MFLPGFFYRALAQVDDSAWQAALGRHDFWLKRGFTHGEDVVDAAFHILMRNGDLSPGAEEEDGAEDFNAVPVSGKVFEDDAFAGLLRGWAAMHDENCGPGFTRKMGLHVVRPGGSVGYHVDGPVLLEGVRTDLSRRDLQQLIIATHASRRTLLALRMNDEDEFLVCGHRVPMRRGELMEFSNVLPHAYYNRGPEPTALLVTTYLVDELVPQLADADA
jgi:hypothetical protein